MKPTLLLVTAIMFLSGCATNQKNRLASAGAGFLVGGFVGAATAPSYERKELHAIYWGGIVGLAAAVAANYYFSDERESEMIRLENEKMKAQLEFFQNGPATLLKETTGHADKRFFQGGRARIKLYKIDQWVEDGPNKRYHRDQMVEILPENQSEQ